MVRPLQGPGHWYLVTGYSWMKGLQNSSVASSMPRSISKGLMMAGTPMASHSAFK